MALEDSPTPVEPRVFVRGNPKTWATGGTRQFLGLLSGADRQPFRDGSGRLELARAIADPDNPMTARALVNRVWMHHFGRPWSPPPATSACGASRPRTPSCSTTWPRGSWTTAGRSRRCTAGSCSRRAYRQRSDDRPEARARPREQPLLADEPPPARLRGHPRRDARGLRPARRRIGGPPMPPSPAPGYNRRTSTASSTASTCPACIARSTSPTRTRPAPARRDDRRAQALFLMNHPFAIDAARGCLDRPETAGR